MAALAAAQQLYLESRLSLDEDECMGAQDGHGHDDVRRDVSLAASDPDVGHRSCRAMFATDVRQQE